MEVINEQLCFLVLNCSQFFQVKKLEPRKLAALKPHYENLPEAFDFVPGFHEGKMHVIRIDGRRYIMVAASVVTV
jgi:hypothetical protein